MNDKDVKFRVIRQCRGEHKGGTKFYEIVQLQRFIDGDPDRSFTIRRYGKMEKWDKGGATMVEDGTGGWHKLVSAKQAGGYALTGSSTGIDPDGKFLIAHALIDSDHILNFYRNTSDFANIQAMAMVDGTDRSMVGSTEAAPKTKAQPASSSVAGWGAW
jgi:hypothetical protein